MSSGSIRIIQLPEKSSVNTDDYMAVDSSANGTKKVKFTDLLDSNLSAQNKAADASATGQAISELNTDINTEALARQSTDNSLQAQIDQLVAPSGTAPNPAEIENARIGADGVTYDTLGNAIRTQVTNLKSETSDLGVLFQTGSINQWDETWANGFYDINTGAINNNPSYVRSKSLIPVVPNTAYFYKTTVSENYIVFFNRNKAYIGYRAETSSFEFTTPADCFFIGISFLGSTYNNDVSLNYPSTNYEYHAFDKLAERKATEEKLASFESALNLGTNAVVVQPSNYSELGITDVVGLSPNRIYAFISTITSSMVSNLPVYGKYCSVVKISPINENAYSLYLAIAFDDLNKGELYFAHGYSTELRGWEKVAKAPTPKSFSVLGDSYSTFLNWNPTGNDEYYPTYSNTVDSVSKTWWHILSKAMGWSLLCNDSYSGATVCTHVRPAHNPSVAFVNRMKISMGEQKATEPKPDVIFILGGQNDQSVNVEIGDIKYSDWTDADLYKFAPAFCYMLDYLQTWNPNATIVNVVNTGLNDTIQQVMASACEHYGVLNIVLSDIEKDNGHPTATGMESIANQVISAIS